MAEDEAATSTAVADEERPKDAGPPRKRRKSKDEDVEHELEIQTPFGKLELEFEPTSNKERRDRKRREDAERAAAKKAEKATRKAEKRRASRDDADESAGGGHGLLIFLCVAGLLVAVAVAYRLFARPGDEEDVPEQYRLAEGEEEPKPEPQGIGARVRRAIRAGRQASREAQDEQRRRFEELTRGG